MIRFDNGIQGVEMALSPVEYDSHLCLEREYIKLVEKEMGDGPAAMLDLSSLMGIFTRVSDILSGLCDSFGDPPSVETTVSRQQKPTYEMQKAHWNSCSQAAEERVWDDAIGEGRPEKPRGNKKQWRRDLKTWKADQQALQSELNVLQRDTATRVYRSRVKATRAASREQLISLEEERRAA